MAVALPIPEAAPVIRLLLPRESLVLQGGDVRILKSALE